MPSSYRQQYPHVNYSGTGSNTTYSFPTWSSTLPTLTGGTGYQNATTWGPTTTLYPPTTSNVTINTPALTSGTIVSVYGGNLTGPWYSASGAGWTGAGSLVFSGSAMLDAEVKRLFGPTSQVDTVYTFNAVKACWETDIRVRNIPGRPDRIFSGEDPNDVADEVMRFVAEPHYYFALDDFSERAKNR